MGLDTRSDRPNERASLSALILKGLIKTVASILIWGAALLLSAGRLDWPMAWAYMGVVLINLVVMSLIMDPELLAERSGIGEGAKKWDIFFAFYVARIGPLAMLIVAGLDRRSRWSAEVPFAWQGVALVAVVLGMALGDWAVLANRFFAPVVRIQKERGQTVVTGGPYRFVRHPGYAASLLHYIAAPFMLGALWALIPAGLIWVVIIIRTALEDRTLQEELEGYKDYTRRVRYRLLPGVW